MRMRLHRRHVISGLLCVAAATGSASGQDLSASAAKPAPSEPDIYLWPSGPPGHPPTHVKADDKYHVANPGMFVFRPASSNGVGILLFQGGGYQRVGRGPGVPTYFAKRGYTVFDMRYRLPHAGWEAGPDAVLQDAQRGVRIIRARAKEFGVRSDQVGVVGFSSGGHAAAYAATAYDRNVAPAESDLTNISARPDFACLGCPVITMVDAPVHRPSRQNLFGDIRDTAELARRSPDRLVTPQTPPMFIVHAADDRVVSPDNSLLMFSALRAAGVDAELHIFEKGGHNMGAGFLPGSPLSAFPDLMLSWLERRGFPAAKGE